MLQQGEWPWCIARRFDVHPLELLAANNLLSGQIYPPGMTLVLPQNARPFPGERALRPHPTVYVVEEAATTVYRIACLFGDVDPTAIMEYNGLTSPIVPAGTSLQIP